MTCGQSDKEILRKTVKAKNNMIFWAYETDHVSDDAMTLEPRETVTLYYF